MVFRALVPRLQRPNGCRSRESETRCNRRVQSTDSVFKDEHPRLVRLPWMEQAPILGGPSVTRGQSASAGRVDCTWFFSFHVPSHDRTSDAPSTIPGGRPPWSRSSLSSRTLACTTARSPRQGRLPLHRFPREEKGQSTALPPLSKPHTIHHGSVSGDR
jgi:hypothetical protein